MRRVRSESFAPNGIHYLASWLQKLQRTAETAAEGWQHRVVNLPETSENLLLLLGRAWNHYISMETYAHSAGALQPIGIRVH